MHFLYPKNISKIFIFSILSVLIVFLLDVGGFNYWLRSGIKIIVFGGCTLICAKPNLKSIFSFKFTKDFFVSVFLGVLGMCLFWGLVYLLTPILDMSKLTSGLSHIAVDIENYWYVTAYIVLINSFLEEMFFRGMCHLKLAENSNETFACCFSSLLFSVYHLTMISNIMHPGLTLLCLIGLFFVGLIFIWLNKKTKNIYNSWIVHACANIAINVVGWYFLNI